ncbi:MAG: UPF0146 family protein [Methanomicrobiales archaeon]|nr:UPF0146 family protein [Methanomicrobiales archaeon]
MRPYKRIEFLIGDYISRNYRSAVEIGAGRNVTAALLCAERGVRILCTDIRSIPPHEGLPTCVDDVFSPRRELYRGAELLYSIRPGIEMVPPMIALARDVDSDLLVYHLGFETYADGGERVDCGVLLHRYHRRQNPSNRED